MCSDACPALVCGYPGVRVLAALLLVKCDSQPGLTGSEGRLLIFQGPDLINQASTVLLSHATARRYGCILRCRLLTATASAAAIARHG